MTRHLGSLVLLLALALAPARAQEADLILHHGKIVTVDKPFSIHQALAIRGERILRVGSDDDVLQTKGPHTQLLDLHGQCVLPGLIDSHTHPTAACLTEFDHPLPDMETIPNVLAYIQARAKVLGPGEWIVLRQVFITRLREQRYPTKDELDQAAPHHPVAFLTGPDASLNSLALKLSGIDKDFKVTDGGAGHAEKDPKTGELTGILRNCTRYVKSQPTGRQPSDLDRLERLRLLFKDYTSVGLTAIADRNASPADIARYRTLLEKDALPLRLAISHQMDTGGDLEKIQDRIRQVSKHPLCQGSPMLRIIGIKTFLDGGMLTGSAYMREPWGVSSTYSITDPQYRGLLFIPKERLRVIVQTAVESGLQFTAHSVGDGAVHTLLDVYDELSQKRPIRATRP